MATKGAGAPDRYTVNRKTLKQAMYVDRSLSLAMNEHVETARNALKALSDQELSGDRAEALKETMEQINAILDKVANSSQEVAKATDKMWGQYVQDIDIRTVDAQLMAAAEKAKAAREKKLKGR